MKFFLVATICTQLCYTGYIEKPFDDEMACKAYSGVYASVMQKKYPDTSGEINCVPENLMEDLKEAVSMGILKTLEQLAPSS